MPEYVTSVLGETFGDLYEITGSRPKYYANLGNFGLISRCPVVRFSSESQLGPHPETQRTVTLCVCHATLIRGRWRIRTQHVPAINGHYKHRRMRAA